MNSFKANYDNDLRHFLDDFAGINEWHYSVDSINVLSKDINYEFDITKFTNHLIDDFDVASEDIEVHEHHDSMLVVIKNTSFKYIT